MTKTQAHKLGFCTAIKKRKPECAAWYNGRCNCIPIDDNGKLSEETIERWKKDYRLKGR